VSFAVRGALAKQNISEIAARFAPGRLPARQPARFLSTGLKEVDALSGGIPYGCITEVVGTLSSGRTSLLLSTLAAATNNQETCALVDATDCFDVAAAVHAGIELGRFLWVRCEGNVEHAFKSVDLLLQGGGFGLVTLDIGDVPVSYASRIVSSWWYRFKHTVENTPTALLVIVPCACVRSCASLVLSLRKDTDLCAVAGNSSVVNHAALLRGANLRVEQHKPISPARVIQFEAFCDSLP
jgi:recombination protein RecA